MFLSTLGPEELNRHIKELESDYNSNIESEYMNLHLMGVVCNMVKEMQMDLYLRKKNI